MLVEVLDVLLGPLMVTNELLLLVEDLLDLLQSLVLGLLRLVASTDGELLQLVQCTLQIGEILEAQLFADDIQIANGIHFALKGTHRTNAKWSIEWGRKLTLHVRNIRV